MIESCGENNFGEMNFLVEKFFDYAEAVEAGHLHVEEQEIRIMLADKIDSFNPIFALGYDIHIAETLKQIRKFVAGELLIVHDNGG